MNYLVFISHAGSDIWVAQQIQSHLERSGAQTFLDKRNIHAGDEFETTILAAIGQADEMVVLFTPAALKREYVWAEIGAARIRGIRVVIVLYGVEINEIAQRPFISKTDVIDINQDFARYFKEVKDRAKNKGNAP